MINYLDKNKWTLDSFLNYVESHSKTERALFHKNMIAEMCHLYGDDEAAEEWANGNIQFRSVDFTDWVNEIRNNLNE